MNIFITGGTGFIGSALVEKLQAEHHQLTILTRNKALNSTDSSLQYCHSLDNFANFNDFDAVINLAGEPIFDKRWRNAQKQILLQSRVALTAQLAALIQKSSHPPHTFLSGSAIGIYGDLPQSANFYTESTACTSQNFAAALCKQWEAAALKAQSKKTRVCLLRTGTVLSPTGGALKKMLPLYQYGLGGKLGSGKQYWAWISLEDHLQAVIFLLKNANCTGAFNLVAPNPVTNAAFNRQLSQAVNRPACVAVPEFALKWALGERASLLLDNQPILPQKLLDAGFQFQDPILIEKILLKSLK